MSKRNTEIPSVEQIASILEPYGAHITSGQLGSISKYLRILLLWNKSVSITSLDDPLEIIARHFGESLFAASFLQLNHGRLADVGTGGGFPGLPLKIAFTKLDVVLIESNLKKCAFLAEIKDALKLGNVEVARSRYEDYAMGVHLADFVCARALGDYRSLLRWARAVLNPGGRVILWLGAEDSVLLTETKGWEWDLPVQIPESRHRVILVGVPNEL